MPKDEWGVKRLCPHCASRFYDLKQDPMTCPECSRSFTAESLVATRGRASSADKAAAREKETEVDDAEVEVEVEDDSSDTDLDDDLLEDDEDDDVSLDEIADVASDDDES